MQKISDKPLEKCPSCGKKTLKKLVSAPVFRLKGGGWYETDFKSDKENKRNLAGPEREESSSKEPAKAATTEAKSGSDGKSAAEGKSGSEGKSDGKSSASGAESKPAASTAKSSTAKTAARKGKPKPAAKPAARSAARRKARR
jgi:predicted nucleic acid-binding Zn ribbon protein